MLMMGEIMSTRPTPRLESTQHGIVLIEAMVAILIFSIGILGIVGMQANMVKNTSDAKYRAEASHIAQKRIGEIWADPSNAGAYLETNADISALLPGGTRTTAATGSEFTVTVSWQQPGEARHKFTMIANIAGG